ncbi:MAG: microviridin/marinostatin family tricyclic proteinase inhibitor [Nostoc sp. ChiSLP02]|nr:microviridin/marinostatin family tricyclic proteinase inhibitor [Nostoc sp. DedSLP05]MDZ8097894.1 microviridin/marinostatin family tricyclic proteinase inhibitor [Nostoc sp. DedSLP01]MDZ8183980.1 microviridin/marinostatin family tricyclic proteinase inhibitor [Nostoc sp. ChiSLP02]
MSTNTLEKVDVAVVPFFARFLQEQGVDAAEPTPPSTPPSNPPSNPPFIYTFKFPSDWEDPTS